MLFGDIRGKQNKTTTKQTNPNEQKQQQQKEKQQQFKKKKAKENSFQKGSNICQEKVLAMQVGTGCLPNPAGIWTQEKRTQSQDS